MFKKSKSLSLLTIFVAAILLAGCVGTSQQSIQSFFNEVHNASKSFNARRIVNLFELPEMDSDEKELFDFFVDEGQQFLDVIRPLFREFSLAIVDAPGKKMDILETTNEAIVSNAALEIRAAFNENKLEEVINNLLIYIEGLEARLEEKFQEIVGMANPDYESVDPFDIPDWDEIWDMIQEEIAEFDWNEVQTDILLLPDIKLIKVGSKWKFSQDQTVEIGLMGIYK